MTFSYDLESNGPDAEFLEPERQPLIDRLNAAFINENEESVHRIPQDQWAALWLSDLDVLKAMAEFAEKNPRILRECLGLRDVEEREILEPYLTSTSSSIPDSEAREACASRDDRACIITDDSPKAEQMYIFPIAVDSVPEDARFWIILRVFWPSDQVARWQRQRSTEKGRDVCENLLTMTPQACSIWRAGGFALKPLRQSQDRKNLDLQFFWLEPYKRQSVIPISERPELLPMNPRGHCRELKLFSFGAIDFDICSGEIFTLHTDDPEKRPLPSVELLEMQWIMHRAIALAGTCMDEL